MELDFSISPVSCCDKYKLCDTTCEVEPCQTVECTDGYDVNGNISKYDIGSTRLNVVFPDGTTYNNVDLGFKPATRAYGEFQITGGSTGTIDVSVNGVLIANAIFTTDIETTLELLVNTANGNWDNTGWYMELIGTDTVKVYSVELGTIYNGLDVNLNISGDLTAVMNTDPTDFGSGDSNCIEFGIQDLYGTNNPPSGNSGPDFQDGVYTFTYIVYDLAGIEVERLTKCILFDCNVKRCVKDAVIKLGDACCSDCDEDLSEKVLKIKSKIEQAHAQLAKGLTDCANKTIKSAGKICKNICLDC